MLETEERALEAPPEREAMANPNGAIPKVAAKLIGTLTPEPRAARSIPAKAVTTMPTAPTAEKPVTTPPAKPDEQALYSAAHRYHFVERNPGAALAAWGGVLLSLHLLTATGALGAAVTWAPAVRADESTRTAEVLFVLEGLPENLDPDQVRAAIAREHLPRQFVTVDLLPYVGTSSFLGLLNIFTRGRLHLDLWGQESGLLMAGRWLRARRGVLWR